MNCHSQDEKWIEEQLLLLPYSMREKIRKKYSDTYELIINERKGEIAAEGIARRLSNTRLRECIDRFGSAYHGSVIAPPKSGD